MTTDENRAPDDDLVTVPVGRRDEQTLKFEDEDWVRVPRSAADHWDSRLWHDRPGMQPG